MDRDGWRYGFVLQHNGAVLVRIPADRAPPANRCPLAGHPLFEELQALMTAELNRVPRLAALELAGYAVLLVFLVLVLPGAMGWLLRRTPQRLRLSVLCFAPTAAVCWSTKA